MSKAETKVSLLFHTDQQPEAVSLWVRRYWDRLSQRPAFLETMGGTEVGSETEPLRF